MDASESDLVALACAGDRDAFDELTLRHRPGLVRLATSLTGDRDEAESLAQEALVRAYEQLAEFRPERPFGPWVRGIVLNLCRNHLRDRTRHARPVAPESLAGAADPEGRRRGVLSGVLKREAGEAAQSAVSQLPMPLREAFVLRFVEGLEYGEIAELTGVAPGTLRVRAHRARTLLRSSLGSVVDTWLQEGRDGKSL
jgi:RNA polymerase sigma-70 factor (ECF subfamily)